MAFTSTPAQLQTLKTELTTDPRGYGYAAQSDYAASQTMDTIRDGTNPPATPTAAGGQANGSITVKRADVSVDELLEAIDARDLSAVNTLQQEYFQILMSRPRVQLLNADGTDTRRWTNLKLGIGTAQGSQARVLALGTRFGSRAEEMFGTGTVLSDLDVNKARNS